MNGMGLIPSIVAGGIAGWLGGVIMKDDRYGLIGDIIVGIVGGLIGGFVFNLLGVSKEGGFFWQIIVATVGSVILLAILRKFRKR